MTTSPPWARLEPERLTSCRGSLLAFERTRFCKPKNSRTPRSAGLPRASATSVPSGTGAGSALSWVLGGGAQSRAGPPLGGPWSPGGPSPCHMSATAPMLPPRPKSPDGSLLLSKFLSPYYPENQPLSWQTGSSGSSLCPDSNPQGQASPAKSPYTGRPGSCTSVGTAPEQTHF